MIPTPPPPDLRPESVRVLDALPCGVFRAAADGRHLMANRTFAGWVGRPAAAVVGKLPADLGFAPSAAEQFLAMTAAVVGTGQPVEYETELSGVPPRRVLVKLSPEFGADGQVMTVLGVATDVTRLGQLSAAARDSEARFRAFMDHLPAVAWVKDAAGRYVYFNPALDQLAAPGAVALGQSAADTLPPDRAAVIAAHDREVLSSGAAHRYTEVAPGRDGTPRPWEVVRFPFTDAAGQTYLGGIAFPKPDPHPPGSEAAPGG